MHLNTVKLSLFKSVLGSEGRETPFRFRLRKKCILALMDYVHYLKLMLVITLAVQTDKPRWI